MVDFLESIKGRLGSLDRRTLVLLGVGGFLVVLVIVVVISVTGGGEGDGDVDNLGELMVFDNDGEDGGGGAGSGGLVSESVVESRVQATLEAMVPTETPVPPTSTPDIGATFEAEMDERRQRSDRILKLNPLDSDLERNPYLNDSELKYLNDMGGMLWSHTKVWMHLRHLLFLDVADWSHEVVEYHYLESKEFLEQAEDVRSRRDYELGEVVESYGNTIHEGMRGVSEGVRYLGEAERLLEGSDSGLSSDLSFEDREELGKLARQVERSLGEFDDAMSRYGCSVCGELFRLRGG